MVLHRHGNFRCQRKRRRRLQRNFWQLRFDGFAYHGQYDRSGAARDGGGERLLLTHAVEVRGHSAAYPPMSDACFCARPCCTVVRKGGVHERTH